MPSLLTDLQKTQAEDALHNVFLTFALPIIIWKDSNTVIVASDENQFNFIYGNYQPSVQTVQQPVSGQFLGSISWGEPNSFNQNEIRPNIDGPICQLDLTDDGYNFLSGYNQIIVNGVSTSIDQNHPYARFHGLFDTAKYKCLYLRRNN